MRKESATFETESLEDLRRYFSETVKTVVFRGAEAESLAKTIGEALTKKRITTAKSFGTAAVAASLAAGPVGWIAMAGWLGYNVCRKSQDDHEMAVVPFGALCNSLARHFVVSEVQPGKLVLSCKGFVDAMTT